MLKWGSCARARARVCWMRGVARDGARAASCRGLPQKLRALLRPVFHAPSPTTASSLSAAQWLGRGTT